MSRDLVADHQTVGVPAPSRVSLMRKESDLPEPQVQDARRRRHRRGALQEGAVSDHRALFTSTRPTPRSLRLTLMLHCKLLTQSLRMAA